MLTRYGISLIVFLLAGSQNVSAIDCPALSTSSPTCNGGSCTAKPASYVEGDCFLGIPFLCEDGYWLYHTDQFECANSCNNGACPTGQACNDGLCEQTTPAAPARPQRSNWFCTTLGWFCP